MAETVLLEEQNIEGFTLDSSGFYVVGFPMKFELISGERYRVVWNNQEHTCIAYNSDRLGSPSVLLGNEGVMNGDGTDIVEPFVVAYIPETSYNTFFTTNSEPATVAIYLMTEDEAETPEGIVLKDRNGNDVAYYGIETVTFDTTTEGKQQVYTKGVAVDGLEILPDFSGGDMAVIAPEGTLVRSAVIKSPIEEKTVGLAMADGDMIIKPSADGKLLSSVTITKPETLTPENIAKDVDIAGIVGTFAGASSVKIATGSFSYAKAALTIAHNLGEAPDLIIIHAKDGALNMSGSYHIALMLGFSSAVRAKKASLPSTVSTGHLSGSNLRVTTYYKTIDQPYDSAYGTIIREANETTFSVGSNSTSNNFVNGTTYNWIAISGLA